MEFQRVEKPIAQNSESSNAQTRIARPEVKPQLLTDAAFDGQISAEGRTAPGDAGNPEKPPSLGDFSRIPVRGKNETGMSDRLKAGIEQLSGIDFSPVRVHYNSPNPAKFRAVAYAQGSHIHLAPGQEQHLPHEAWHLVQQQQGRVKPTLTLKGESVNDSPHLEAEAEAMGNRALQTSSASFNTASQFSFLERFQKTLQQRRHSEPQRWPQKFQMAPHSTIQRVIMPREGKEGEYFDEEDDDKNVGKKIITEYAFVKQDQVHKTPLVFAQREQLKELRDEIVKTQPKGYGGNSYLEIQHFRDWFKQLNNDLTSSKSTAFKKTEAYKKLQAVKFMYVDLEGGEEFLVEGEDAKDYWLDLQAVLLPVYDKRDKYVGWGQLTAKKAGFGERAPIAAGTIYLNQDFYPDVPTSVNGVTPENKQALADFLGADVADFSTGKFKNVSFQKLDATAYHQQYVLLGATGKIDKILGFQEKFFYVSSATREDSTQKRGEGNYQIAGETYDKLAKIKLNKDKKEIKDSYKGLVVDRSLINWERVQRPGARIGTQAEAMNKWNALGMAAYAKEVLGRTDLDINQDYEWLHIKGVQNGGRNEIKNLGTGTWITNSQMIPFENKIRAWANKPGEIFARYTTKTNPDQSPVLDEITIEVAANEEHEIGPINKEDPLKVTFFAQKGTLKDTFSNKIGMRDFLISQNERQRSARVRQQAKDPNLMNVAAVLKELAEISKTAPLRSAIVLAELVETAILKLVAAMSSEEQLQFIQILAGNNEFTSLKKILKIVANQDLNHILNIIKSLIDLDHAVMLQNVLKSLEINVAIAALQTLLTTGPIDYLKKTFLVTEADKVADLMKQFTAKAEGDSLIKVVTAMRAEDVEKVLVILQPDEIINIAKSLTKDAGSTAVFIQLMVKVGKPSASSIWTFVEEIARKYVVPVENVLIQIGIESTLNLLRGLNDTLLAVAVGSLNPKSQEDLKGRDSDLVARSKGIAPSESALKKTKSGPITGREDE